MLNDVIFLVHLEICQTHSWLGFYLKSRSSFQCNEGYPYFLLELTIALYICTLYNVHITYQSLLLWNKPTASLNRPFLDFSQLANIAQWIYKYIKADITYRLFEFAKQHLKPPKELL